MLDRRLGREAGLWHVGDAHPILYRTGRLEKSLADRNHPEHLEFITARALAYGSMVPYALVHEQGRGHVPQRQLTNSEVIYMAVSRAFTDAMPVEFRRDLRAA